MQAASDLMLGWVRIAGLDGVRRDFYVRQLWDQKGSADVETMSPRTMATYARCAGGRWPRPTPARATPSRSRATSAPATTFDRAIAAFAETYADQNERDYAALRDAVDSGRVSATTGSDADRHPVAHPDEVMTRAGAAPSILRHGARPDLSGVQRPHAGPGARAHGLAARVPAAAAAAAGGRLGDLGRRGVGSPPGCCPAFRLDRPGAASLVAAVVGVLNASCPRASPRCACRSCWSPASCSCWSPTRSCCCWRPTLLPDDVHFGKFGDALLASLAHRGGDMVLQMVVGTNDDDEYTLRVTRRIARRQGAPAPTDVPGIVFLEIDGLALPVLRDAMRDGSAPDMARWIAEDGYRLAEWETDLSSQTGASQAGILLGSNEDIPAFRWVEKERDG